MRETFIPRMKRIPKTDSWVDIALAESGVEVGSHEPIYDAFLYVFETYGDVDFKLTSRDGIIYGISYEEEPIQKPTPPKRFNLYGE
jgi:hypothetical protein